MLVVLSDTHRDTDPGLTPHLEAQLADAELLVHAGDFVTEAVYERFDTLADDIVAVHGNRDRRTLTERLPTATTVEWADRRLLVTHGHRHDGTSLSLLARQEAADVVVTGHTHRPVIGRLGERLHVNPGSHAQPRGNRAAYAVFEREVSTIRVTLTTPDGTAIETVTGDIDE